jgi:hypothetical protein
MEQIELAEQMYYAMPFLPKQIGEQAAKFRHAEPYLSGVFKICRLFKPHCCR